MHGVTSFNVNSLDMLFKWCIFKQQIYIHIWCIYYPNCHKKCIQINVDPTEVYNPAVELRILNVHICIYREL